MNALAIQWVDVASFAELADIRPQKARQALQRGHHGKPWRGQHLVVRKASARGAPQGLKYQVRVDSLPMDLQNKWREQHRAEIERDFTIAPEGGGAVASQVASRYVATPGEHEWRHEIIRPALAHPPRSRERGAAITEIIRQRHPRPPDGARRRVSERTVRAWIAAYEAHGMAGLTRKARSDRKQKRHLVSNTWDRGVLFEDAVNQRIADQLRRKVRSLWRSGATGWRHVQRMATVFLVEQTQAAGLDISTAELLRLCAVPRAFVERERRYAQIAIHDKDAKHFFDKHIPRIQRTREGMSPMEVAVGDVHHMDILVTRQDGSVCTPKAIAWHDVAANRIFVTVVFLEKGKGVRMEHVAGSFIEMTQHDEWGMPKSLYLDNGGEYNWAKFVEDAMRLNFAIGDLSDYGDVQIAVHEARRSPIIRARPYNAPAKTIEGVFGVLEGGVWSMLPGWVGGNRMVKKTANVGKEPEPFTGTADDFRAAVNTALGYYHTSPQSGHLKGKSPHQALVDAVAAGWKRVDIDRHALEAAFAREVSRKVTQGAVQLDGRAYIHRNLGTLTGTSVRLRIPIVGDKSRLPIVDDAGNLICIAEPARTFQFLDAEGAREQNRRARELRQDIANMRRETDELDLLEEMGKAAALHPEAPDIPSAGIIRLSEEFEAIAAARRQLPAPDEVSPENEVRDLWRNYPRHAEGQD